jgi:hypothetical protein
VDILFNSGPQLRDKLIQRSFIIDSSHLGARAPAFALPEEVRHRLAWTPVAEVGPTVEAFPSAADIVSWAGVCPGNNQTATKRKSGTTRAGNPWLRRALCEAAWAASKSKGTYLQAQFRRLAALRGPKRALIAVASSILTAGYYMLQRGTTYQELGHRLLRQTQQPSSHPSPGQTPRSSRAQGRPRASLHRLSITSEQQLGGIF